MDFFDPSCVGNGCRNSNLMNSKIVTFACYYSRNVKKLWYFRKQNILRVRENYVKFFTMSYFGDGYRNSNLMNSKIVIFTCQYSHNVKKLWYFLKKKYHEEEKIT